MSAPAAYPTYKSAAWLTGMGLMEPVTGLANTNTQAGFQPMMLPACEVKTIGFQPQNALSPLKRETYKRLHQAQESQRIQKYLGSSGSSIRADNSYPGQH
jgi:hypothetical protein